MTVTYKVPAEPKALFPMPIADEGTKTLPAVENTQHGRASVAAGFPVETQLPLSMGGVAPNRLDFNGMFNMLSAFAFWQQSGGLFSHNPELNYAPPSQVFHAGKLWWCVKENGPSTPAGPVLPGSNEAYWLDLLSALALMGEGGGGLTPVGTVITYYAATAPRGYFACDGSNFSATAYPKLYALIGSTRLPDLRGYFVRGHDTRNSVDPAGSTRGIGSIQQDAGRDIWGRFRADDSQLGTTGHGNPPEGSFYVESVTGRYDLVSTTDKHNGGFLGFAASRSWGANHTASEFRPKNTTLLYCIKHD